MKIRTYLVLMTSAVLIPIIFFSAVAISALFDSQRDAVLQSARESLNASLLRAETDLSRAVVAVSMLAQSDNLVNENWSQLYTQAKAAGANTGMVTVVLGRDGLQKLNTIAPFGRSLPQSVLSSEDLDTAFAANAPQISNVLFGQMSRRHVISVYLPVTAKSGTRYVVAQGIFADHFKDNLPAMDAHAIGVHSIFDRNGSLIASNALTDSEAGSAARQELRRAMMSEKEGMILNEEEADGRPASYTLFARSPLSGWTFTLDLPVSKVEAVPRHAMVLMALELLCVVFFVAVAAAFFGRRLARSIEGAFDSAAALRQGIVPSPRNSGIREFEALQSALHEAGQVLKDVAARRAELLEREREARSTAETQNATKDQFLAMLGHELRNPLAPISSAAQLLAMNGLDTERNQRATDIIVRQVRHMTYLVDELLDVSRVTRGLIHLERKKLDMRNILADAEEQVQPTIHAMQHRFFSSLPDEAMFVLGDHKRLVQIFTNILANAAKYTPQGGEIRLSMEAKDGNVQVTVTDNGIGMSADLLGRAFDLFAQAERTSERSQGGLGLGLALVKSLVAMHGGSVSAHSDGPGKGSRFVVSLPRVVEGSVSQADTDKARISQGGSLRILVVDDNHDAANMLGEVLKALGHQPIVEYDPLQALRRVARRQLDVCLLDIGLPTIDGYELARRLRALPSASAAVMIAISGYGQRSDCERALSCGFERHFVKPVDMEALIELLNEIAHRKTAVKA
ncbi:MAG TPA: ATP-binding protein [Oxalicibacterium sp.]|jgi:signal transduction histidine kinase/ActR/RegA family two-component response regulator|nr:ATP-binding protein [Oxalicibacterium sp.]